MSHAASDARLHPEAKAAAMQRGLGRFALLLAAALTPLALRANETASSGLVVQTGQTHALLWKLIEGGMAGVVLLGWVGAWGRTKSRPQRRILPSVEAAQEKFGQPSESPVQGGTALHHSIMDNLPAGIYRKDKMGRYSFANTLFCQMHGVQKQDVLGKTVFDLLPPDEAAKAAAEDETVMTTGKCLELEKQHPGVEGKFLHIHICKTPIFDAAGDLVGTQGMVSDITVRKATEAELDSERGLLRFLLDNSPDCVYFKDRESRFIKVSQRQAEFFGFKHAHELVGKTDFDFFDHAHAQPAFQDEQEIIRTGAPLVGKIEKELSKDGRVTWALTSKMPLRDQAGQIIGTFGISKEITAMKESEAQLAQAHRQLLEISRMAGMAEVATSVLHNVGNVLNSVNVSSSMISDKLRRSRAGNLDKAVALLRAHEKDLNGYLANNAKGKQLLGYLEALAAHLIVEQKEMAGELDSLIKNIDHIKEIVSMQQSYSRVAGICETLAPAELVEDALRMNGASLDRHGVVLQREFSGTPAILVDKHKVLQILVNLLRNAKHACDDSKRPDKRVTVRVGQKGGDRVSFSVIDNGIGIPAENLDRIFNHGFTTRSEGHGFGLHSGALAAREMGGALTLQSGGAGLGAVFTLELPLQPPQVAPASPAVSAAKPAPPRPARSE